MKTNPPAHNWGMKMIVNKKTGRIAFHSLLLKPTGELNFIQYDYDGKELDRILLKEEEFISPELLTKKYSYE